jgi:hypothetical protein
MEEIGCRGSNMTSSFGRCNEADIHCIHRLATVTMEHGIWHRNMVMVPCHEQVWDPNSGLYFDGKIQQAYIEQS